MDSYFWGRNEGGGPLFTFGNMLTLSINAAQPLGEPILDHYGLRLANGRIDRFASPHLDISYRCDGIFHMAWIGEGIDPAGYDSSFDYTTFDDYEGAAILLAAAQGSQSRIEIRRTKAGGTPLYIAAQRDRLVASWRFEDAVALIERPQPNRDACRHFATYGPSLVREQIIDGVSMLWPGEICTFEKGELRFIPQSVPSIIMPSFLLDNARATDAFVDRVQQEVELRLRRSKRPLIELSGGFDSTCVGIAAGRASSSISSYGLIHEGPVGKQQSARRRELCSMIGAVDFEFPSFVHTPFVALDDPECQVTHMDDNHRLSCARAIDAHPDGPFDLVITGIGGDELAGSHSYIRQEWELPGSVPSSTLVACFGRSDLFMRRGIWPCNPLGSSRVIDFCRRLPDALRSKRIFNVVTMARAGLSDGFIFPRYKEHYGYAMQRECSLIDFDDFFAESVVADFGILDITGLLQKARDASLGGFSYELIGELWYLSKLDRVLRRYVV